MLPFITLLFVTLACANPQGYNYSPPPNPLPLATTTTTPPPPPPSAEYLPPIDSGNSINVAVSVPTAKPVTTPPPSPEMLLWDYKESIPGEPESDYPILEKIPETKFKCDGRIDGYYADVETRCQVFHICTALTQNELIKSSFLCPNGTLFNQENFACQWWADVDCPTSDQFYKLNENIGVVPKKAKRETVVGVELAAVPAANVQPGHVIKRSVRK